MITSVIRISPQHENSDYISIQQAHVDLFVRGQLHSVLLMNMSSEILQEYKGIELSKLIGSAISRGRKTGTNYLTNLSEFYYLGDR
jgi:hypothetical protein